MDNTVKIWDLETGTCLHTLMGHTSLVGLLGLSPNYLISAAADSSLRVWDADEMSIQHVLRNNGGAITCFRHDEHKVISGSDGMLKLWDIRRGKFVRDLIIGISSVWQVAINGNLLVAASNRGGATVFDIFDFGKLDHPSGVDNEELDNVNWEITHPRESIAVEMRKKGHLCDWELDHTILEKEWQEQEDERANSYDIADEEDDDDDDAPVMDADGNPVPWPFDRQPTVYTIPAKPARPIVIDVRPIKKKSVRKSTRISIKSTDSPNVASPAPGSASRTARLGEYMKWKGNKSTSNQDFKALIFQTGSPSAMAGTSKLPARSLSKVLGTTKDDKGKGKGKAPANAVASGSGSGTTRKAPPAINTRITRSRSGPGSSSPARVTRTSSAGQLSAPSRKRSFAPVFDDDDDEEVEEELEELEDKKERRLLRAKKELDEEDELESDPEEGGDQEEEEGEGDDDMLGID